MTRQAFLSILNKFLRTGETLNFTWFGLNTVQLPSLYLHTMVYYVEVPFRTLECATKPFKYTEFDGVNSKVFPGALLSWLLCHLVALHPAVHINFFGIWGNFKLMEYILRLRVAVWNFLWRVSEYLSVCMQEIESGWPLFHMDFYL